MSAPGDMPAEEVRRHAHDVADWVADFLTNVEGLPVLPAVIPGQVESQLAASAPRSGESMEDILRDFREVLVPGTTHWNHPGFFAYFANTASGPGILGETLTAALNSNAMVWRTGPAATELEGRTLDWLRQMLGLPDVFRGHINDTASVGSLVALAAARHVATEGRVRDEGLTALPPLRFYTSAHAHSSIEKSAIVLGVGTNGVRKIPVDDQWRMDVSALRDAIAQDRASGALPVAVTATVGTTTTASVDPVPEIAEICREEKLWLHVDAAYGGAMGVCPEYRTMLAGCEHADSFLVNPHKWLFTPMDCSALYCRDQEALRAAFSLVPGYLMTAEQGASRDLMDYGPALGRRNRALKLWMVLRYFGVDGCAERIRHHVKLAQDFAKTVDAADDWEVVAPVNMSLVLYRHRPSHLNSVEELADHNRAIMDSVNGSGRAFISQTQIEHPRLGSVFALRTAVGNLKTQQTHLDGLWEELQTAAAIAR